MSIFKTILKYAPGPALALAIAASPGCWPAEGQKIDGPADGIVTQEEAQVREAAAQANEIVPGDDPIILDIMRDDLTAMRRYLEGEGIHLKSTKDLHVYTVRDRSEMSKKWKDCGVTFDSLPSSVGEFYCDIRTTIYDVKMPFQDQVQLLSHEIFHHFHAMDISNSASEFPAESGRGFLDFFRWANDYFTAQILVAFPFPDRLAPKDSLPTISSLGRYSAAMTGFIMAVNDYDGNATLALQEMITHGKKYIRSKFSERADEYGVTTGRDLWLAVYYRLVYDTPNLQTWYQDMLKKVDSYGEPSDMFIDMLKNKYEEFLRQIPVIDSRQ